MSTQLISVSSTQFLRGFLSERDLRHFCTKTRSFLEKWLNSFLCTWNMSTRFINSEKVWVLVSYKAVSYRKNVYIASLAILHSRVCFLRATFLIDNVISKPSGRSFVTVWSHLVADVSHFDDDDTDVERVNDDSRLHMEIYRPSIPSNLVVFKLNLRWLTSIAYKSNESIDIFVNAFTVLARMDFNTPFC